MDQTRDNSCAWRADSAVRCIQGICGGDALYHADAPLQALVGAFNKARQTLMDERAAGEKDGKIEQAQKSMQELYDRIAKSYVAQAAVQKQAAYDKFLQQVYNLINFEINGEDAGGCSGGCASCSGCH